MRSPIRAPRFFLALTALVAADTAAAQWPRTYDPLQVQILEIYTRPADWTKIVNDQTFEIEVPAVMRRIGETWLYVSMRRKSGTPVGAKISLKIDVNEYVKGQEWHGVKKLSLENGDDADVLSEGFAWYLHRVAAQTATSGGYKPGFANWAAILLNGKYLGVYVNVEQPDKTFMKNRNLFTSGSTWLYKQSNVTSPELKVGTGDSSTQNALCYSPFVGGKTGKNTCPTPTPTNLALQLNKLIDTKSWLTYAAVSSYHSGPDQMFTNGKNFFYIDFAAGHRQYVPWDLDSVFGKVDESIFGRSQGGKLSQTLYQKIILENPTFKAQYKTIYGQLLDGPLSTKNLLAFLDQLEYGSLLPLALRHDPNGKLRNPHAGFERLRTWVRQRPVYVRPQLK